MLMRFDPFQELSRAVNGTLHRPASLPMDAYREGDHVHIWLDVPGVHKDDLDVTVDKSSLTVTAHRGWEPGEDTQLFAGERPQGRFQRTIHLGDNLQLDELSATYEDGVLHLVVPVAETAKPRKVEVGRKAVAA